jgi:predicted nucleotidyltransferase
VNRVHQVLHCVTHDLNAIEVRWALIGGLAVSVRAEPRTTRDVDVAIAVASDAEAEEVVFALTQRNYQVRAVLEQTSRKRLATVRLVPPVAAPASLLVDLLFSSSAIEVETVASAQQHELLPGLVIPVATVPHLIAMKLLARDDRRRPQDWDDLRALAGVATAADRLAVFELLDLIKSRGAGRDKDLHASWLEMQAVAAGKGFS